MLGLLTARARAIGLLAVLMSCVVGACGGGLDAGMLATLTDDQCTYEGDQTPNAEMFTIKVKNGTKYFGAFALAALSGGKTIDDLEPWLKHARQQFAQSGTLPTLPPFYEQVVRTGIEAGTTGNLPADVKPGRYALMCFVDDLPTWRVYPAAQLDVSRSE